MGIEVPVPSGPKVDLRTRQLTTRDPVAARNIFEVVLWRPDELIWRRLFVSLLRETVLVGPRRDDGASSKAVVEMEATLADVAMWCETN